jgi:hypothetical protein
VTPDVVASLPHEARSENLSDSDRQAELEREAGPLTRIVQ